MLRDIQRVLDACLSTCLITGLIIGLAACSGPDDGEPPPDPPDPMIGPESPTARVRFKGNDRLRNDLARALQLDQDEVCNELGQYSCTHEAHQVALGGSAPYQQGLYRPLPQTTAGTPIAVDRVALSACITRIDRDLTTPAEAVLLDGLEFDNQGNLPDVNAQQVADFIDELYKRAVQRPATAEEIEHHRQLYRDIEARGVSRAVRQWTVLSCFAVMSSMEQLFY